MKLAKQIIKVIWPIIYSQLDKLTNETESKWDDIALDSMSFAIMKWIELEEDEEDQRNLLTKKTKIMAYRKRGRSKRRSKGRVRLVRGGTRL